MATWRQATWGGRSSGGIFIQLYFQPRDGLAAEMSTSILTDWYPGAVHNSTNSGHINDIVERNGVVYLGGSFTSIGGVARMHLAAADAASGALLADWNPQVGPYSTYHVNSIASAAPQCSSEDRSLSSMGTRLAGISRNFGSPHWFCDDVEPLGGWRSASGRQAKAARSTSPAISRKLTSVPRENLGAFDLTSGLPSSWPQVNGDVYAILALGRHRLPRRKLLSAGRLAESRPRCGGRRNRIAHQLDRLHRRLWQRVCARASSRRHHRRGVLRQRRRAATQLGGVPALRMAAPTPIGTRTSACTMSTVISTAPDGGVFLGGGFQSVGGRPHAKSLARVSPATGLLDAPREFPLPTALELSLLLTRS